VIFVTVGTQLPFDRLIQYVDAIAPELSEPVFAQVGTNSKYQPKNIECAPLVNSASFNDLMKDVSLIVGHAGIGTIIAALQHSKPLVLMPRLAALQEHRNDHQLATVNSLSGRSGIYLAQTEQELRALLLEKLSPPDPTEAAASRGRLIAAVSSYIHA